MSAETQGGTDDLERLRAAFTADAGAAFEPSACPSPERLWDGAAGRLGPGEIRELVDHLATCAACAEDWRTAAGWQREVAIQTPAVPVRRIAFRPRPWLYAAAAAVVLAAVGVPLLLRWNEEPPPIYREGEQAEIRSRLADGEALPRERCVLRWEAVTGAVSYEVLVSTEDLRVLANPKELTATELQVPAAALADLPPGARLAWQVTATRGDGGRLRSRTFLTPLR